MVQQLGSASLDAAVVNEQPELESCQRFSLQREIQQHEGRMLLNWGPQSRRIPEGVGCSAMNTDAACSRTNSNGSAGGMRFGDDSVIKFIVADGETSLSPEGARRTPRYGGKYGHL